MIRALCIAACACAAFAPAVGAQVRPPLRPPPVKQDTVKRDTVKTDSLAKKDTTIKFPAPARGALPGDSVAPLSKNRSLVDWDPPDSTMRELLDRKGYRQVQYQGDKVRFDAETKVLRLNGGPAAVMRDQTMLIGDSIVYDDSTKHIVAMGDSVTLRDPTQQKDGDDVVAAGKIDYDLNSRSGSIGAFATSVAAGQGTPLFLSAKEGEIFADTLVSGRHIVFARDGSFTYCNLTEPHFHFTTRDMKFISQNVMVARPGVLYIGEVPVFWIPFFFQDVRTGRRSGLLTPDFGIAELVRNSPGYRRQISNVGYFLAINNYMSTQLTFDWRSSARANDFDPGFVRTNGEYTYRWLDRFVNGKLAVSRLSQANGNDNTSVTWNHAQEFSKSTRLSATLNWTKDTHVHQATTINPLVATGTIRSDLNYQTKIGPTSLSVGGTRTQYPGRSQVDMTFPTASLTTAPLSVGAVTWTPNMRVTIQGSQHLDQTVQFPFAYKVNANGVVDSTRIDANTRNMNFNFDTPIKIFDFVWQNSFTLTDRLQDYPSSEIVYNVNNPADTTTQIFRRTYQSDFDWTTSFSLPSILHGTWNIAPSISVSNVDQNSGMFVRRETSKGEWVGQSKRLQYSIGSSPTLYAMFPGIGPIAKFRHSISPTIGYLYSPAATVSDEFLSALNHTRQGYLGALAMNRVSLGLSTNLEAKMKVADDSLADQAKKIRLLSLQFSSLSWDFIRADTAKTGLSENNFSISAHTDLLPGLDFRTNYSLFQGDPMSDTATFSPFRQDLGVSFSLDSKSGIFALIGKLLGFHGPNLNDAADAAHAPADPNDLAAQQASQQGVASPAGRGINMPVPSGGGWRLNLQFNGNRQRPPRGGVQIIDDPTTKCEGLRSQGDIIYNECVQNAIQAPPSNPNPIYRPGAPIFISQPTQNVVSTLNFNITPNWAAQWATQYDAVRKRFASHQVGLARELHDWNATFSFMQSPTGAFSFSFFIALKAQPDLKFDYNRSTYRSSSGF